MDVLKSQGRVCDLAGMARMPPVAENLRRLRDRRGFSQYTLADASGVSRPSIADIERGATTGVRLDTLLKLAQALEVEVADLVAVAAGPDLDAVIDRFLDSDYAKDAKPTADEIAELRRTPLAYQGGALSNKTISVLLDLIRSRKQGG